MSRGVRKQPRPALLLGQTRMPMGTARTGGGRKVQSEGRTETSGKATPNIPLAPNTAGGGVRNTAKAFLKLYTRH